jgi:hypothetical protein
VQQLGEPDLARAGQHRQVGRELPGQRVVRPAHRVPDVRTADHAGEQAVHLGQVHQLGEQLTQLVRGGIGVHQCHLCPHVAQHPGADRMAFGVVGVQQAGWRPATYLGRQLPADVDRVLQPEVEALAAHREVDVRGVAGEQHPPGPVPLRLQRGVAEAGQPARLAHRHGTAGDVFHRAAQLLDGDLGLAVAVRSSEIVGADPAVAVGVGPEQGPAPGVALPAGRRGQRVVQAHVTHQRRHPRRRADERYAGQPADRAPGAVTADHPARADLTF